VRFNWDEPAHLAKVSVRQIQKISETVGLFKVPLTIRFKGKFGTVDRTTAIALKDEDFSFPLESAPEIVRLDPECVLLARLAFQPSPAMIEAQLKDTTDVVGRVIAVEQLAARRDAASVAKLKQLLNNDPFFGVRSEAARALRGVHSEESLSALLDSTNQPDARVRLQVVEALGGFYNEKAYAVAIEVVGREKNPAILATAIRRLGEYSKPEVHSLVLKYLDSDSFRNELADAAIGAIGLQDDPSYVEPLKQTLSKQESAFTSFGFGAGLGALGRLSRNEQNKDAVREFLQRYLNHKKRSVRIAAITALGALGDPKAIAVVTTFASAAKETPERGEAERVVAELRAGRKPVDDLKALRQEVLDFQKTIRDQKAEIEEMKKQLVEQVKPAKAPQPANEQGKKKKPAPAGR
jgi:aminopeptidase N